MGIGCTCLILFHINIYMFLDFSFFDADEVMWGVGATTFAALGLSVFALQTKVSSL